MRTIRRRAGVVRFVVAVAVAGGFGMLGGAGAAQELWTVSVVDNWFGPTRIEIDPGDAVQWRYQPGVTTRNHTVTTFPDAPQSFSRGMSPVPPNDQFVRTFDVPGTYKYYCQNHGNTSAEPDPSKDPFEQPCVMCGVVVVKGTSGGGPGGGQATPAPTPPPTGPSGAGSAEPTTAPRAGSSAAAPSPSAPAGSGTPGPATPSATLLAAEDDAEDSSGRGAVIGLAVAAVLIAAAGGLMAWRRLGARAP